MKDFLKKLIESRKKELESIKKRMEESDKVDEVRALGETILKLRDEINEAEKQLAELEKEDNPSDGSTDPNMDEELSEKKKDKDGCRSLNPMSAYSLKPEERKTPVANRETMKYREAFMDFVRTGKRSEVLEMRVDDQNEVGDLGVLLPMTVVQEIVKGVEKVYGQLYSRVKKTNIKGGVKYPIGAFDATFTRITENGAPTDRQNGGSVTGYVEFSYKIGEIRLAQTLLASIISVPAFEAELAKVIVEAYVKAMDVEILSGDGGANQCEGILTEAAKGSSGRIPTANVIEFTDADMADWKSWQKKLFAKIPLSMRALSPQFVMTASTYEANIKTLADGSNRPVYNETYNPVDGTERATFKGKEVVFVEEGLGIETFDDATNGKYFGIYWVPEKAYAVNTNLEFAVKRYFDEEKLQWVDRAVVINDGKILDPKYIYLLKKKVTG